MNEGFFLQVFQRLQDLDGEASDEAQRDTFEVIVPDELVQVD